MLRKAGGRIWGFTLLEFGRLEIRATAADGQHDTRATTADGRRKTRATAGRAYALGSGCISFPGVISKCAILDGRIELQNIRTSLDTRLRFVACIELPLAQQSFLIPGDPHLGCFVLVHVEEHIQRAAGQVLVHARGLHEAPEGPVGGEGEVLPAVRQAAHRRRVHHITNASPV
jgi:hypothetical protein